MAEPKTEEEKVRYHLGVLAQLEQIRRVHEPYWQEQIDFASPARGRIFPTTSLLNPSQRKAVKVYDTTAQEALNALVDGYQGSVVGRSLDWLNLKISHKVQFSRVSGLRALNGKRLDEIPEVTDWLSRKKEVYYSALNYSNFYDTLGQWVRDAANIGHGALDVEENKRTGQLLFTAIHPREGYIGDNRYDRVDTYYRKYKWTLRKMVEKFGLDTLSKIETTIKNKYERNPYEEYDLIHATYPRDSIEMYRDTAGTMKPKPYATNKPWASLWIWKNRILLESGFDYMRPLVWRWDVNTGELYGWCPTSAAIVDILTINQVCKDLLHGTHMAVDPMWSIPEEMRREFKFGPRAFNYYRDPNRRPFQEQSKSNIPIGMNEREFIKKQVESHYYKDAWTLISQIALQGTEMTAYQVQQIVGERAILLGAKIGRFYSEGMDPLIDLIDDIESEAGRMPPPPPILFEFSGASIDVDYCGPLAQAQKSAVDRPIVAWLQGTAANVLTIAPEAKMRIDFGELLVDTAKNIQGFPPKAIRSEEQINAILQAQQQQAQQAQMMAGAAQMGKMIPGMGKQVDPSSPLAQLMGGDKNAPQ